MNIFAIYEKTFTYLTNYFCQIDELAELSKTKANIIKHYIKIGCIPDYSYRIKIPLELSSALFGELIHNPDQYYYFYAKGNVNWIHRANKLVEEYGVEECTNQLINEMRIKFRQLFIENKTYLYGFDYLFDNEQSINEVAYEREFQDILLYWRNGTYGLCTQNMINEESLFHKKLTQKWLKKITQDGSKKIYSAYEVEELKMALMKYESCLMPFSPLDYPLSSRKFLIDDIYC